MEQNILILNIGSTSKKYAYWKGGTKIDSLEDENSEHDSLSNFIEKNNIPHNAIVGIRIVAPGSLFKTDKKIDDNYINALHKSSEIAPLHIEKTISEIDFIKSNYKEMTLYGISDSSFHASIPKVARTYAIPKEIIEKFEIERQGYHGLSISSVVSKIFKTYSVVPEKMIICHLGGGTSITGLKDGMSVDTSMGFTPLEGTIMAERGGNIDPGVISLIAESNKLVGKDLVKFLSKQCGLKALSGVTGNMKELIENRDKESYQEAIDTFVYSIKKEIGKMYAILNGCDTLVFTGTIGERSAYIRSLITQNLENLNINLDQDINDKINLGTEIAETGLSPSQRSVLVVSTDEMTALYEQLISII